MDHNNSEETKNMVSTLLEDITAATSNSDIKIWSQPGPRQQEDETTKQNARVVGVSVDQPAVESVVNTTVQESNSLALISSTGKEEDALSVTSTITFASETNSSTTDLPSALEGSASFKEGLDSINGSTSAQIDQYQDDRHICLYHDKLDMPCLPTRERAYTKNEEYFENHHGPAPMPMVVHDLQEDFAREAISERMCTPRNSHEAYAPPSIHSNEICSSKAKRHRKADIFLVDSTVDVLSQLIEKAKWFHDDIANVPSDDDLIPPYNSLPPDTPDVSHAQSRAVGLYLYGDDEELSEYECFMRKQLEFCEPLTPNDGKHSRSVVGLRCCHCAHKSEKGATIYPIILRDLAQSANSLIMDHVVTQCPYVSVSLREELMRFSKLNEKNFAPSSGIYWCEAAKLCGVESSANLGHLQWAEQVDVPSDLQRPHLPRQYYNYRVNNFDVQRAAKKFRLISP